MNPNQLPKGQSSETSPVTNPAGTYELKTDAGVQRVITAAGNDGNVQADALVRIGFSRVGNVPSREELLKMQQDQAETDKASEPVKKNDK